MIVKLHKYLIWGKKEEKGRFFELAQRSGFLEFIGASKKEVEFPEEGKKILQAIKLAKHFYTPTPFHSLPPLPLAPLPLSEELLSLHTQQEALFEEERLLTAEIARIAPFGHFSRTLLDEVERDAKRVFQFLCMKSTLARGMELPPEVLYVGTDYDLDYFIAINREAKQYPQMIELEIERPVGELRARLEEVKEAKGKIERELYSLSQHLPQLQEGLTSFLNEHHLAMAKEKASAPLEGSLFAAEAWVPATKRGSLQALLSQLDIEAEEIGVEERDLIPTCMENRGAAKLGEDLVHVYDIPAPTDQDPSLWVMVFFALFFAIIISDAGYGLIYFLAGLLLWKKFPKAQGLGKRFIKMTLAIGLSCIVWGVCTASFFGIEIGPDNPFRKSSFLHYLAMRKAEYHLAVKDDVYEEYVKTYPSIATAKDGHQFLVDAASHKEGKIRYEALEDFYDNVLMEISLVIGIFHISLSFLRYLLRNWAGLGWVVFMIGGYLFFPTYLNATTIANFMGWISKPLAATLGWQMLWGGVSLAILGAFLQKRWAALGEIMNAIQVFADVLSYLRLYALALAGMVMAGTFNNMGASFGLLAGIPIILGGHLVNITVSLMGAVIHGLRLNFLEWYHYSFEGGGRLFNPLRIKK